MRSYLRRIGGLAIFGAVLLLAQDWQKETTLPGVDLAGMAAAKVATALRLMRGYDCSCGCGMKVAECRIKDPGCAYSKGLAGALVEAVKGGKNDADALAAAKASKYGAAPAAPKLLEDPIPITTAGSPVEGPANAAVTLVEW